MKAKILLFFVIFCLNSSLKAENSKFFSNDFNIEKSYSLYLGKIIFQKSFIINSSLQPSKFKVDNQFKEKNEDSYIKNFILGDKDKYKLTLLNYFLFLIPPLTWNLVYGSNNPAKLGWFEGNAPKPLLRAENIFRVSSMAYPMFLEIDTKYELFNTGLTTYLAGLALYFTSWAYLMKYPNSELSKSPILRFAPAYTPVIWMSGMSMMSDSKIQFVLSCIFIALHVGEYVYKYEN